MPELHDLLTDEADRQVPSSLRPFDDLVRTRDSRRRRRAALAGAAAVVLVGAAAVAIAQPGHDRRSRLVTDPSPTPSAGFPVCDPQDIALSLHWAETGEHGLLGTLTATNTNGTTCTLLKRPTVFVTTADGNRAPLSYGSWSDARWGNDELRSGDSATSLVTWNSWCGGDVSRQVEVTWTGARSQLPVRVLQSTGAEKPSCTSAPATISAGWFEGLAGQDADGLLASGTFELDGGPYPGGSFAHLGHIELRSSTGEKHLVLSNGDGVWQVHVPPGHYAVTGGTESASPCSLPLEVTVADHSITGIRVVCAVP